MSENFDIGPLTWVKDQIDQLLESVLGNLNTVQANIVDTSALRFSQTHLYQASGALDMVGLEGCKRFCSELEKLAAKLEKKTVEATPELIETFIKAVKTLQLYLQELLNGAPDIPLRLFPMLNPIVTALGETLDESELFFPDTSNSAPKDIPSKQLTDIEYASFMVEQRLAYQKSLLNWLQTKQNSAVETMTMAVSNVSQAQQKNSNKTLWWAASAFTESLEQKEIAENNGAKRLCRKLDQELRQFAEGINKPHSNLLRDILYYVAISDIDKPSVLKVKEVFELAHLVDKKSSTNFVAISIDHDEIAHVQQLIDELEILREQWDDISNTIDFSKSDASASNSVVNVDNVLITKFSDTLAKSVAITQHLSQVLVIDVYSVLQQASNSLRDDASKVNHAALIEIAAALNLIETSLQHYQNLDSDRIQKLHSELLRLETISSGEGYDKLEGDRASELDRDTVKAVVTHIKESLKTIEQALDSFFRNPAEKKSLTLISQPLKQVSAVFDMLNMASPIAILNASGSYIHLFEATDYVANQTHFELVAESLSMIGLYVDEMPRIRPESDLALEKAIQRLHAGLKYAGIEFIASDDGELAQTDITGQTFTPDAADNEANAASVSVTQDSEITSELTHVEKALDDNLQHDTALPELSNDQILVTDQAFDEELLDIYLTEAEEVLALIAQNLQALRVNATDHEALVEVRRSYHTLKGSGRTVGLSAMGEVAGKVEIYLNGVLDKKLTLTHAQIISIEQISAAFASWAAELRANNKVEFNQEVWLARVAALSVVIEPAALDTSVVSDSAIINELAPPTESTANVANRSAAKKAESLVLIGGTRKMSRALYDIFINESMQNITALEQDAVLVSQHVAQLPSAAAKHAIHKLGSNALAAEFKQMGELSRALENWLDEVNASWTSQHSELYSNTVKLLAGMWQKISEQHNPRSANGLIKVLNQATDLAKQNKAFSADINVNTPLDDAATPLLDSDVAMIAASNLDENLDENQHEESIYEVNANEPELSNELVENLSIHDSSMDAVGKDVHDSSLDEASIGNEGNTDIDGSTDIEGNTDIEVKLITESKPYNFTKTQLAADKNSINTNNLDANKLDKSQVDQELLTMFIEEAREILPEIGTELRAWRANPNQTEHPDALQRSLHTLKGSARMAGQASLGNAVHELEDLVIRSLKRKADAADFDSMFVDLDKIGSYFEEAVGNTPIETINAIRKDDAPPSGRTSDRKAQYLRMRADTLDRMINEAGEIAIIRSRMDRELTGFKNSSNDLTESVVRLRNYLRELEIEAETQLQSRMSILQEANETFDPLEFDRFTRLQELTRMIAESVNDVATIQNGLLANLGQTEAALQQQSRMNRDLQQSLLGVRMLPFKQISERMQRIVRQTARELKKSVDLEIDGEATEIDRSVLDKLGAPLEHLLRNAVAHGLESPAERKKLGKSETGIIKLKIRQESDEINIIVSDDGAGVNLQRVKEKAIKNKLIDEDAVVSEQALMSLIFESGFSTADKVSQISGRGVGLDVVRADISGLGGRVDLNSEYGKGAEFSVHLPVTLSVAQVLVVRAGTTVYGLPVGIIEQAQKIKRQELAKAYEAGEIEWADKKYPIYYLSKLLDLQEHQAEDHAYASILLLRIGSFNIALHIDEVIGNQEAVMKPIGAQLARVPGIVGATVTGDGSIMLIINPVQLVAREILSVGNITVKTDKKSAEKIITKLRALVVDDSLTMRKVLGRTLERAGFEVLVAKDGMDAMQLLQETIPDIILTDIEMPRMDGFGLARNIRDDVRTAKTPLIMISSRTADKHQNLAKEIGVDAFFGKPVQDDDLIRKVNELLANSKIVH